MKSVPFRTFFIILLVINALPLKLQAQFLASSGVNIVVPGQEYRNLIQTDYIDYGIGVYGDNQVFLNDDIALKYEGSYTFMIGQGMLRADHTHISVGSLFYMRSEGYLLRPYAGAAIGMDFLFGNFFFANAIQGGLYMEFSEGLGLDFSVRYRMSFGRATLIFMEPRVGLILNFGYF